MNIAERTGTISTGPGELLDASRPIVTLARDTAGRYFIPVHRHLRAQLVYASTGVLTVSTTEGRWVVPPQQAVWVPAGTDHEVRSSGAVSMCSLYVDPSAARELPIHCCVLTVPGLMRQLILKAVSLPNEYGPGGPAARLMHVILDQLRELEPTPLHLPMPHDPRLKPMADTLVANPADNRDLGTWAQSAGASARTLARLFLKETGMTFGNWRQRLRLQAAVARLGAGQSVTTVAYDLGYQSPSAFIAMFKRVLGAPPAHYFRLKPMSTNEKARTAH
ncbi:MAG: helix-turn-helix transcriptional regulator [Acidiferrobacterales bacterium]